MKRILVTGKSSYIGTSFARYAGLHYPEELEIEAVSVRDESWKDMDFSGFDAVLHVAGIAHADVGHATEEEKQEYYRVNTRLALEAAEKARDAGVGQFVLTSSMIVYGAREHVTRQSQPAPVNFYGDSKWKADKGVRELETSKFRVAVLRLPLVYGRGSKGNYPVLARLAGKLPMFPKVENRRSVIYVENLCEFLCGLLLDGRGGIFFPQDREQVSTARLVKTIAACRGHRILLMPALGPLAALGRRLPGKAGGLCRKAFGSSYYDSSLSEADWNYHVVDLEEAVRRTEGRTADTGSGGVLETGERGGSGPLVSVTTVTRNSEKTIARTIESVLAQTYDRVEYLVVDGLSRDRTVEIAESYREKFAGRGYEYRIISEADQGMYDAINKGIRLSEGEIIGNINSDDWYEPQAAERAAAFLQETGADYMYADLRMVRADGTGFVKRAKLQRMATSRGWNHPTQFARRAVHERFPYKLESLHDDFDFFLKVRKSGLKIGVCNEVLANFTMEGMSHEKSLSAAIARGRCRYRIYRNNGYGRLYALECILIEAAKLLLA